MAVTLIPLHDFLHYTHSDSVHHAGNRLSTGAYRTRPVTSLCDAAEPPLEIHRLYHVLSYFAKISLVGHPAYNLVVYQIQRAIYECRGHSTRPLGIRAS